MLAQQYDLEIDWIQLDTTPDGDWQIDMEHFASIYDDRCKIV